MQAVNKITVKSIIIAVTHPFDNKADKKKQSNMTS